MAGMCLRASNAQNLAQSLQAAAGLFKGLEEPSIFKSILGA
jgi:hypothetical protein